MKIFLLLVSMTGYGQRILKETNVAMVDGYPILKSEITDRVAKGPLVMFSPYPSSDSASKEEHALQDAINIRLLMARAKDLMIDVSDEDIQKHIDSILSQNNLSLETLKMHISREGKTFDDYKEDIRQQMLIAKYRGRHVYPNAKVTDKEAMDAFEKKSGFKQKKIYGLQYVLLNKEDSHKAEDIYEKLKKKIDFQAIQKEYPRATVLLEPINLDSDSLSVEYKKALDGLDEKMLTKPISTASGVQILYIDHISAGSNDHFLKAKEEIDKELRQQKMKQVTESWIRQARQASKIEIFQGS